MFFFLCIIIVLLPIFFTDYPYDAKTGNPTAKTMPVELAEAVQSLMIFIPVLVAPIAWITGQPLPPKTSELPAGTGPGRIDLTGLTIIQAAQAVAAADNKGLDYDAIPTEVRNAPLREQEFEYEEALQALKDLSFLSKEKIPPFDARLEGSVYRLTLKEAHG